jgi:hypothetical protein
MPPFDKCTLYQYILTHDKLTQLADQLSELSPSLNIEKIDWIV